MFSTTITCSHCVGLCIYSDQSKSAILASNPTKPVIGNVIFCISNIYFALDSVSSLGRNDKSAENKTFSLLCELKFFLFIDGILCELTFCSVLFIDAIFINNIVGMIFLLILFTVLLVMFIYLHPDCFFYRQYKIYQLSIKYPHLFPEQIQKTYKTFL